ncbi:hypothetical protein [Cellulomonas phragmiteti]|uniref:Polysaccharide biosynthesis protein n=1 Tax=Cellulomonas phragmiteti TaxID=478780 RepID=A0ABQ4DJX9_9CELL|nr:hypothetical protein [Cellulomonas phragmiteti]GIG39635.1 hypothetical protein Cph01nite_13970 [Cellulomonas phragmiteti]
MGDTAVPAVVGRRDAVGIAVATGVSALSGYAALAVATNTLDDDAGTVFVTWWSLLFVLFGLLSGFSVETTRAVAAARRDGAPAGAPTVRRVAVGVAVATLALCAAATPLWTHVVLPAGHAGLVVPVVVGALAFAVHSALVGALAGTRRWAAYARLVGAEAVWRLVLVGAAALLGLGLGGLAWGAALAATAWVLVVLLSSATREVAGQRLDAAAGPVARRVAAATVAAGASAVLVVGYPALLAATTAPADFRGSAPLLIAITVTRAPLLVPLNAFQGVAVAHFVAHQHRGLRALAPLAGAVVAAGIVAAGLATLVGPALMSVFGPGYRVDGALLGVLTLAAVGLALLTLTGALCQSFTRHRAFVAGWLAATGAAVLVLQLPGGLEQRAVLGLVVGPAVGLVVHLVALARGTREAAR